MHSVDLKIMKILINSATRLVEHTCNIKNSCGTPLIYVGIIAVQLCIIDLGCGIEGYRETLDLNIFCEFEG